MDTLLLEGDVLIEKLPTKNQKSPVSNLRQSKKDSASIKSTADQAKSLGLVSIGGAYWAKAGRENGGATHKSVDGKIIPLDAKQKKDANSELSARSKPPEKKSRFKSTSPSKDVAPTANVKEPAPINLNLKSVNNIIAPSKQYSEAEKKALRGNDMSKVQAALRLTKQQKLANEKNAKKKEEELKKLRDNAKLKMKTDPKAAKVYNDARRQLEDMKTQGVGAGEDASRAGECAVVSGIQHLSTLLKKSKLQGNQLQDYAMKEIDKYYTNLANEVRSNKNLFINESWVNAGKASARRIVLDVGADNIDEVVWDTPEGRALVGTNGHGTSSDMFILDKKGQRWGISLKKDANVFLMNRSMDQGVREIADEISDNGNPELAAQLVASTSATQYKADIGKVVDTIKSTISKDPVLKSELLSLAKRLGAGKIVDHKIAAKYLPRMGKDKNGHDIFNPERKWIADDMKLIIRLMEYGAADDQTTTFEKMTKMRAAVQSAERAASNRLFDQIINNPEVDNAMKNLIIEGTHIFDVIGAGVHGNKYLDKFQTVYGSGENGASMNLRTIGNFFKEDTPQWDSLVAAAQKGDQRAKKQINQIVNNRIRIDLTSGASSGTVKYKRANPTPPPELQEYTIFGIRCRVKEMGSPPSIVLEQNESFVLAMEHGTDINKWPPKQKSKYYESEYTNALVDLSRAVPGTVMHKRLTGDVMTLKNTLGSISGVNIDKISSKIQAKINAGAYEDE